MIVALCIAVYVVLGCAVAGMTARRLPKSYARDSKEPLWLLAGLFWPLGFFVVVPGLWAFRKARGHHDY